MNGMKAIKAIKKMKNEVNFQFANPESASKSYFRHEYTNDVFV